MEFTETLSQQTERLASSAKDFSYEASYEANRIAAEANQAIANTIPVETMPYIVAGLTVFVLACFVGYYVVWHVTPALHSPLMAVTNAVSSVIIVGAVIALGATEASAFAQFMGFMAVMLASINIFGGFIVTRRMLQMFKKKN